MGRLEKSYGREGRGKKKEKIEKEKRDRTKKRWK